MKRIFIAVKVIEDNNFIKQVSSLRDLLAGESIKWTSTGNIHITLAFLGDTDENLIGSIGSMLREKCRHSHNFEIVLRGFGVFKNFRDPRILWMGIDKSDELNNLNSIIMRGLRDIGIKMEDRPFSPHLTIGRIRSVSNIKDLKNFIENYAESEIQRVPANDVILYESILKQTGSVYKPLFSYKLPV